MEILFLQLFILSPVFFLQILSVAVGIFLMWQVLSSFFEKRVVLATLLLIFFGTNLFWLTISGMMTAHSILFSLLLAILWLTLRWQREKKWYFLAAMLPVMILISFSATGMYVILIPLFFLFTQTGSANMKSAVRANWRQLLFLLGVFILCVELRQFQWFSLPWEASYSGNTLIDRFAILPANINRVLFSVKNGWIVYTPLVIPAIAGFYFLAEKNQTLYYSTFLFLLVSLIYTASIPQWWYNDSFGYPNLIETYAVLSIPLGFFIQWSWQGRRIKRVILAGFAGIFVLLNLFQTWQFNRSIIFPERMTEAYYLAIFGKTSVPARDKSLMESLGPAINDPFPDGMVMQCSKVKGFDFEQSDPEWSMFKSDRFAHSGKYALRMNPNFRFSPGLIVPIGQLTSGDSTWIKSDAYFYYTCKREANIVFMVITSLHNGTPYKYKATELMGKQFSPGQWNKVTMNYLIPVSADKTDSLHVFFWNYGGEECYIDDFEINLCKPKR